MSKSNLILNNIPNEYEKTPGYLIYDVAEAVGQVMDQQDLELARVKSKQKLDNLEGEELKLFVKERKGIIAKPATYAIGEITVNGTGTVYVGDLFETANGVQFKALDTVEVVDTATIPVQAVEAGNVGVVGSHSIIEMPITITGIVSCDNAEPTHDGYDAETDESIKQRYLTALQTPVSSGNKASYKNWALEVTGIGDVKVFPLGHGPLTVDVVAINSDKQPASTELVQQLQAHIDPTQNGDGSGKAPIGAVCYVSSAAELAINISVKLITVADHVTVETKIKQAITNYLKSIAFKDDKVSYAQIGNCIIDIPEVMDYENLLVNGSNKNVPVTERQVAVLGTMEAVYE